MGVEADAARVLTNQGRPERPDVRVCTLADLKRKLNNRRASVMDGGAWGRRRVPGGSRAVWCGGRLWQPRGGLCMTASSAPTTTLTTPTPVPPHPQRATRCA